MVGGGGSPRVGGPASSRRSNEGTCATCDSPRRSGRRRGCSQRGLGAGLGEAGGGWLGSDGSVGSRGRRGAARAARIRTGVIQLTGGGRGTPAVQSAGTPCAASLIVSCGTSPQICLIRSASLVYMYATGLPPAWPGPLLCVCVLLCLLYCSCKLSNSVLRSVIMCNRELALVCGENRRRRPLAATVGERSEQCGRCLWPF